MALQNNVWSYLKGLFHMYNGTKDSGGTTVDLDTNIRLAWRISATYNKDAADGNAGDATAATYFWYAPRAARLISATIVPSDALVAHDTNYATVLIKNSAGTTLASQTTKITGGSGNWSAGAEEAMTVASATIASGETLSFSIAKAAGGVAVPICCVSLEIEWV